MHVVQGELSSERSSGRRYLAKSTAPFGSRASPILSASRSSHHRCPAEPSECTRTPRLPGAKPWRGEPRRTRSVGPSQFAGTAPLRFPVCCAVEASSVSSKGPPPPLTPPLVSQVECTRYLDWIPKSGNRRGFPSGLDHRHQPPSDGGTVASQHIFADLRTSPQTQTPGAAPRVSGKQVEPCRGAVIIAEHRRAGEFHTQGPPGRRQVATLQNLELQRDEANERRVWAVWVCLGGAGSVGA